MPEFDPATETAVANEALSLVGIDPVVDLAAESSQRGRVVRKFFGSVRDASIRRYPWNFASARALLPAMSAAPAFGFQYQYAQPQDCLRVLEVNECDARDGSWKVEARAILTDFASPIRVRFLRRETSVALWDPQFRLAFAYSLAAAIAPELAKDSKIVDNLSQQAQRAFLDAFPSDAVEGTADELPVPDIILTRFG
jgi:hypothetical protein